MKKIFILFPILTITICVHAQNVGIGTTNPLANLHIRNGLAGITPFPSSFFAVESNTNTYINLLSPAINETAILFGLPSNAANGVIMYNNPATPNGFQFRNNGNLTRLVIANNGNVGIGVTNPAAKLHISAGDASLALFGPNSYSGQLYVGASSNQGIASTAQLLATDGNLHMDPAPGKNMYLGYFQARDIYINPFGGRVGIGTTVPGASLEVNGYSKLGNDAPAIKYKKFTGTTSGFDGGYVYIPHDLDYQKIIAVSVVVYAGLVWHGPGADNFTSFDWSYYTNHITVHNIAGRCASILSKPIKILVTYED